MSRQQADGHKVFIPFFINLFCRNFYVLFPLWLSAFVAIISFNILLQRPQASELVAKKCSLTNTFRPLMNAQLFKL